MIAQVLDFQQAVRRRNGVAARRNIGHGVEDAITQAVMEIFKSYPISIVDEAIQAARTALANGVGFMQAMDAAVFKVSELAPHVGHAATIDARNLDRLNQLAARRERYTAALQSLCERMIRAFLLDQPETEIAEATKRAQRVLMGGGTPSAAIYHATNIDRGA